MEIKVKDHKTPRLTEEQWKLSVYRCLQDYVGDLVRRCSYCGGARIKGHICSCGFDKGYASDLDEDGNLVEVYIKLFE